MSSKDYSTGLLILRLNAIQSPVITRGMMLWRDISWCDIHYMTGSWFINGCKAKASEIDDFITKVEAMCE